MTYSLNELSFILYNNRSSALTRQFLPPGWNPLQLLQIERYLSECQSRHRDSQSIEVDLSQLLVSAVDLIFTPSDLASWTKVATDGLGQFNNQEQSFLSQRQVPILIQQQLIGLSNFPTESYDTIGASCHPVLRSFLLDGIADGGIVFPLFQAGNLVNIAIRRLNDLGKLKYTLAVPDISVWGLENVQSGDEVWLTEGIFDCLSLQERGIKAVTVSSAMWSGLQLYQLLDKKPGCLVIVADNDQVGYLTAQTLTQFFDFFQIPNIIIHTTSGKDMAEYFWELQGTGIELEPLVITPQLLAAAPQSTFNLLNYWNQRTF